MKVIVRREAEDDLDGIYQWIATNNPRAAREMISRILDRISLLEVNALARMGRCGFVPGTFELIEHPYIIVYRIQKSSARSKYYRSSMAHANAGSVLLGFRGAQPTS